LHAWNASSLPGMKRSLSQVSQVTIYATTPGVLQLLTSNSAIPFSLRLATNETNVSSWMWPDGRTVLRLNHQATAVRRESSILESQWE